MLVIELGHGESYIAQSIASKLRRAGVQSLPEYDKAKNRLYDITMSCDRQEAIDQMVGFMQIALSVATGKKDNALRGRFLAAFDIWSSLVS